VVTLEGADRFLYVYVEDADLLYAEWRTSGVSGQFFKPHDTPYGLRKGAHVDRDGNLLRSVQPCPDARRLPAFIGSGLFYVGRRGKRAAKVVPSRFEAASFKLPRCACAIWQAM
jgi:hypothetical protein